MTVSGDGLTVAAGAAVPTAGGTEVSGAGLAVAGGAATVSAAGGMAACGGGLTGAAGGMSVSGAGLAVAGGGATVSTAGERAVCGSGLTVAAGGAAFAAGGLPVPVLLPVSGACANPSVNNAVDRTISSNTLFMESSYRFSPCGGLRFHLGFNFAVGPYAEHSRVVHRLSSGLEPGAATMEQRESYLA